MQLVVEAKVSGKPTKAGVLSSVLLIVYIDSDHEIENHLCSFMFQWGGLSSSIFTQRATCTAAWEVPPFFHIQQPCPSGKREPCNP